MVFAMIEEQKMDQFIEYIEAITPEELIGELTQNKPTKSDLDIITGIREQGVTDPVVNAILHYMLLINRNIPWPYIHKLTNYFVRQEIDTAREAIKYFQKQHEQMKRQNNPKTHIDESTLRANIIQAIEKGYNNEQLGQYVRSLFE